MFYFVLWKGGQIEIDKSIYIYQIICSVELLKVEDLAKLWYYPKFETDVSESCDPSNVDKTAKPLLHLRCWKMKVSHVRMQFLLLIKSEVFLRECIANHIYCCCCTEHTPFCIEIISLWAITTSL